MKRIVIVLLAALILVGCVTTKVVTSPDQYAEINELGKDRTALITVQTRDGITAFEGEFVTVLRDSVYWLDVCSQLVRSVPLDSLYRIRFKKSSRGAVDGGALGLVPGAVLTAVAVTGPKGEYKPIEIFFGICITAGGAVVGGIIGSMIKHKTDYVFHEE